MTEKKDGEQMAFIADSLQPLFSLLFANSPFAENKLIKNNFRLKVWNNTDKKRCGNLMDHKINNFNRLLESYIEYILTVPTIFAFENTSKIKSYNSSLGDWLLDQEFKGNLSTEHILSALHQIFTHVRFKNVVEIRGGDRPPFGYEMAPAAFWAGLLTTEKIRTSVLDTVSSWTIKEKIKMNKDAEMLRLSASGPEGKTLFHWIEIISDYALKGLEERSLSFGFPSEKNLLEPFLEKALSKVWVFRAQKAFKKKGKPLKSFLKEKYS